MGYSFVIFIVYICVNWFYNIYVFINVIVFSWEIRVRGWCCLGFCFYKYVYVLLKVRII